LGHPIIGCDLYAHEAALSMADRLLLHATTLVFEHPVTGKAIRGECPAEF
jgi:tRNA pseudouridine32 synthase/23S rRNA pseudouridine746 synthase